MRAAKHARIRGRPQRFPRLILIHPRPQHMPDSEQHQWMPVAAHRIYQSTNDVNCYEDSSLRSESPWQSSSADQHSDLDDVQHIDEQFRYTVISDDQQCEWDKHHMDITPDAKDRMRCMLCSEGLRQASMCLQSFVSALKIGLLAGRQGWKRVGKIPYALDSQGAIRFERLGLARAEALYSVF